MAILFEMICGTRCFEVVLLPTEIKSFCSHFWCPDWGFSFACVVQKSTKVLCWNMEGKRNPFKIISFHAKKHLGTESTHRNLILKWFLSIIDWKTKEASSKLTLCAPKPKINLKHTFSTQTARVGVFLGGGLGVGSSSLCLYSNKLKYFFWNPWNFRLQLCGTIRKNPWDSQPPWNRGYLQCFNLSLRLLIRYPQWYCGLKSQPSEGESFEIWFQSLL